MREPVYGSDPQNNTLENSSAIKDSNKTVESAQGPLPVEDETFLDNRDWYENYSTESEEAYRTKRIEYFLDQMVVEMNETGELLDSKHPLYQEMLHILSRLRPSTEVNLLISLSDELKAMAVMDKKTIVISAGLISRLKSYLEGKGKSITKDHIAFILAHELSHWDPEAVRFHLNETYCDTNGLLMCSKSGFSTDAAVEALGFLEWLENEFEKKIPPKKGDSKKNNLDPLNISHSHPRSESRRVLGLSIANDSDIHLEGRYSEPTIFDENLIQQFLTQAENWKIDQIQRHSISTNEEVFSQFSLARTKSQILETFLSADEFYHARIVDKYARSKNFEQMLLVLAWSDTLMGVKLGLDASDFYTLHRCSKIKNNGYVAQESTNNILSLESLRKRGFLNEQEFLLITKCFNGEVEEPLKILTADSETLRQEFPEFSDLNFDNFFRKLVSDIDSYLHARGEKDLPLQVLDYDRLEALGLSSQPIEADYTSLNGVVSPELSKKRLEILEQVKLALASSIIRQGSPFFKEILSGNLSLYLEDLPNYKQLHSIMQSRLLESGSCKTKEVAYILASLFVMEGRFFDSEFRRDDNPPLLGKWPGNQGFTITSLPSFLRGEHQVQEDILNNLFRMHLSLVMGTEPLSLINSKITFNRIPLGVRNIFREIVLGGQFLNHPTLDPYIIYTSSRPTIGFQNGASGSAEIDLQTQLFTEEWVKVPKDPKNYLCNTDDPENVYLLLTAVKPKEADKVDDIRAIFRNNVIRANLSLIRFLLKKGINEKKLRPDDIRMVLESAESLELYREFYPFLSKDSNNSHYHETLFRSVSEREDTQDTRQVDLIHKFINEGGLVSVKGGKFLLHRHGAELIPFQLGYSSISTPYQAEEDPEFTRREAMELGKHIVNIAESPTSVFSDNERNDFLDAAFVLMRYGGGTLPLYESVFRPTEASTFIEALRGLPTCSEKDSFIKEILVPRLKSNVIEFSVALSFFQMLSVEEQRTRDFVEGKNMVPMSTKVLSSLPLSKGSTDISEQFPFRSEGGDVFLNTIILGLAERLEIEYVNNNIQNNTLEQLLFIEKSFPIPSGARDYFVERSLLSYIKGDKEDILPEAEAPEIEILEKALSISFGKRTRDMLSRKLIKLRLEKVGYGANLNQKLLVIISTFPEKSAYRDVLIQEALNNTYTTWEEIIDAETYLLGHNYQSDTQDTAVISGVLEGISLAVEAIDVEDRVKLMIFLADASRHLFKPEEVSNDFFDDGFKKALKKFLVGDHFIGEKREKIERNLRLEDHEFEKIIEISEEERTPDISITEEEVEMYYPLIVNYLKRNYLENPNDSYNNIEIPEKFRKVFKDQFSFEKIINIAVPQSVIDFFKKNLTGYEKNISVSSLGSIFLTTNPSDRRLLVYRLCLGDNGFFEDSNFSKYGIEVIDSIINLATKTSNRSFGGWGEQDISLLGLVVKETYKALSPSRRTEVFSKFINMVAEAKGRISKEQLIKLGLSSFGVVGQKIGQMDLLIPDNLREILSFLKEDLPALPKTTIASRMTKDGRDEVYSGLGEFAGKGSTAVAILTRTAGSPRDDAIVKMIRPDVEKYLTEDLKAAEAALRSLNDSGFMDIDPSQIMSELHRMIREELDTSIERSNTRLMGVLRKKFANPSVSSPTIIHRGNGYLELSLADGISLNKVEELLIKEKNGEWIPQELLAFTSLDLQNVYKTVVADFLAQVNSGLFHTDLHTGNIFVDVTGRITEIDHGQVGIEDAIERRRAMFAFILGVAGSNPQLLDRVLRYFDPEILDGTVLKYSRESGSLLRGVTRLLSERQVEGSVNRFVKAMINVMPYIQKLDKRTLMQLITPYIRSRSVLFDLVKSVPGFIVGSRQLKKT